MNKKREKIKYSIYGIFIIVAFSISMGLVVMAILK